MIKMKTPALKDLEYDRPDFSDIATSLSLVDKLTEIYPDCEAVVCAELTETGRGYLLSISEGAFTLKYAHVTSKSGDLIITPFVSVDEMCKPSIWAMANKINTGYPINIGHGHVSNFRSVAAIIEDEVHPYIRKYMFSEQTDIDVAFYRYDIFKDTDRSLENVVETINWCAEQNTASRNDIIQLCKELRYSADHVQQIMSLINVFQQRGVEV